MTGVLSGVRVIDFTERVQGPFATQILGDLGADVIKIERVEPVTPDGRPDERYGGDQAKRSLYRATFLSNNRNKRSVALDLKTDEGREIALELIAGADVVYENFRPGVMDRLGLGFAQCQEVNPGVIYVHATGYGSDGPFRDRPGQDVLAQALSGMGQMNVNSSGRPQAVGMSITDVLGGLYGAVGALAAIIHRNRYGEGQEVSVDLLSSAMAALSEHFVHFLNSDSGEPERQTEMHAHGYIPPPYGFYRTRDGYLALSSGRQIEQLCELVGIENLQEDPRFDSYEKRLANRAEMEEILEGALSRRTTQEWLEILVPQDIFAQRVNTLEEAARAQVVQARKLIQTVVRDSEEIHLVAPPISFSVTPSAIHRAPPIHGEHTREILDEIQRAPDQVDVLYERRVVA